MTAFSAADLERYKKRNPQLFPDDPPQKRARGQRLVPNGYANEAAFQADVKTCLEALGWTVQESLKGSAKGGGVFYGKGWPDLQVFREDGQRRLFFLELKQPGNKPTPEQLECHETLKRAGFTCVVAYYLEECLQAAEKE